jgi:hypothetical protein
MGELRAYHDRTAAIWEQWPKPRPADMRFASHWERGMMSNSTPNLVQVRELAQMLATLAITATEDNDPQRAADMIERGFQLAQAMPSDSLVSHTIRQAISALGASAAERSLNRTRFTDQQLRQIARSIPRMDTNFFVNAMRGDHCLGLWAFGELKSGRSIEEMWSSLPRNDRWWNALWRKLKPWSRVYSDEDFVRYLDMYRSALEVARQPSTQAVARAEHLITDYANNVISECGQAVQVAWSKGWKASIETDARLTVLHTSLALERFRISHNGSIPATLSELVPDYLIELPRDTLAAKPLGFKTLPRGYVVYSIGADGVDDGGLERTNNAVRYDVTITVER